MGNSLLQYRSTIGRFALKAKQKSQPAQGTGNFECGCHQFHIATYNFLHLFQMPALVEVFDNDLSDNVNVCHSWYVASVWFLLAFIYRTKNFCKYYEQLRRHRLEQQQLQQTLAAEKWFAKILSNYENKMKNRNSSSHDSQTSVSTLFAIHHVLLSAQCYLLYIFALLKLCNDIETNPGPALQQNQIVISDVTQGSFHQGNEKFSVTSVGKQCVANAAVALMFSVILSPEHWQSQDLDNILNEGDSQRTI